jgi:hypothetical protein
MDLISLLVWLIVWGLVFWAVRTLSGAFGIPAPLVHTGCASLSP